MVDPAVALGVTGLLTACAALVFWPTRGLYPRWRHNRRLTEHVLTEDALKHLFKCSVQGHESTVESVAGALQITVNKAVSLMERLAQMELAALDQDVWRLTPAGQSAALHIVRAHRLWERYLADKTGFAEADWHHQAELHEHELLPAAVDELAAELGNPTHDPHGDPIPDAAGNYVAYDGQPLSAWPMEQPARIVHVEDEPETIYAQLLAEGLYPGMEVKILETTSQRVRFWANGDEHVLAPIVAANITVASLVRNGEPTVPAGQRLVSLRIGEQGQVTQLSPRCRGAERRRMMDLGILPGVVISAELFSPSGGTTAYKIRDALIALRAEQASLIYITPLGATP